MHGGGAVTRACRWRCGCGGRAWTSFLAAAADSRATARRVCVLRRGPARQVPAGRRRPLGRGGGPAVLCCANLCPPLLRCPATCLAALSVHSVVECCTRPRPAEPRAGPGASALWRRQCRACAGAGASALAAVPFCLPSQPAAGPGSSVSAGRMGRPAHAGPLGGCAGVKLWPGTRPC